MKDKEHVYEDLQKTFGDLSKTAKSEDVTGDLRDEEKKVENCTERWEKVKKTTSKRKDNLKKLEEAFDDFTNLYEKLHHGVPAQIDNSVKEPLVVGLNSKKVEKEVKRIEVWLIMVKK